MLSQCVHARHVTSRIDSKKNLIEFPRMRGYRAQSPVSPMFISGAQFRVLFFISRQPDKRVCSGLRSYSPEQ